MLRDVQVWQLGEHAGLCGIAGRGIDSQRSGTDLGHDPVAARYPQLQRMIQLDYPDGHYCPLWLPTTDYGLPAAFD